MVRENLARIRERISKAAEKSSRAPDAIKLVVVTKEAGIDEILQAIEEGVRDIGENRLKDALAKKESLDSHVLTWHMIGHLQSNKAKEAVKLFSVIHSVDSAKLAEILNKEARKNGKVQDIFIEVNVSGEKSKFGVQPKGIEAFLKEAETFRNLKIRGLMTMAPFTDNAETTRPVFKKLKELADANGLKELSMGMSQDFEVAIEEGSTMVRIGRAIFKQ
ncbi:MAG: YggS family pyridoxal phosphate-dependent enzyme [Candidatus Omnitrophica bacterium]|nr:YggS family pyridoxal phosphate-dependent enzyme [Candidatus Omnitrophota bacterium]